MPPFDLLGRPEAMAPNPVTGKRGFTAFDTADAACGKRTCAGFGVQQGIENVVPHAQAHAWGRGGLVAQGQPLAMQTHQQPYQHPYQQHVQMKQYAAGHTEHSMRIMDCGNMPCGDGMDVDGPESPTKYERFPSKATGSPTHWHKSTAIGYVPPLGGTNGAQEECLVRMWECEFAGKNDYY